MAMMTCGACGTTNADADNASRCSNCRHPLVGGAARYYIAQGDQVSGPFSYDAMSRFVSQGKLQSSMQVSLEGGAWIPAGSCPELFAQPGGGVRPAPQRAAAVGGGQPGSRRVPQSVEDVFDDARPGDRRRRRVRLEPHRGGTVLTLGILGLVICLICGIIAWVMGAGDLRKMREGRMDRSGQGTTQAGMICGIIGTILGALGLVLVLASGGRGF